MEKLETASILDMAGGAIMERVDLEMSRILWNIRDPNTSATAARKITVTLTFKPDAERKTVAVTASAKPTLAETNGVATALYIGEQDGKPQAVEMTPNLAGQTAMDGSTEERRPKIVKLVDLKDRQVG
jgi:hypothetical protein